MRTKILLIVLVLCLALVSTPRAQNPAPSSQPAGPTVGLSMIVTDKDGKGVNSIRKDQIRVFEDGDEQTVLSIDVDERPVDCVLLIDASGSFKRLITAALEAAKLFIVNRRPDDKIAVVRFVSSNIIEDIQAFTTDNTALLKALDTIHLQDGQSAVVDALYIGVNHVTTHNNGNEGRRKVVVIITDGEDRNSYYKQEQLITLLRQTGVQVFIVGLVLELETEKGLTTPSARQKAEKLLTTIAYETGGRVFFPANNKKELIDAAAEIILNMRAQFRIKFQSARDASKKGFRKVDVKFVAAQGDEKRILVTPRGYFVGSTAPPAKSEMKKS